MTRSEIAEVVQLNLGKIILATPTDGAPEKLRVLSVDEEGLVYNIIDNETDPDTQHWWPFDESVDVGSVPGRSEQS